MNRSDLVKRTHYLRSLWASKERQAQFWSRIQKNGECWEWTGPLTHDGYGQACNTLAHRVSYFLSNAYLYLNAHILHRCDNPRCINPAHLFEGDQATNMADMKTKGRRKGIGIGESNGRAVLTLATAQAIRAERSQGYTLKTLAQRYGVGISTISRVVRGESWT